MRFVTGKGRREETPSAVIVNPKNNPHIVFEGMSYPVKIAVLLYNIDAISDCDHYDL